MTVIGFLSVAPVREGSMAEPVADAIEALAETGIEYELTPMGTVLEGEDIDTVLAAVAAAHKAVDGDRVSTFLKIDDKRTSADTARSKVDRVTGVLETRSE